MLSLDDDQLHDVIEIAAVIPVTGRDAFLRELAIEFGGPPDRRGQCASGHLRARRTVMRNERALALGVTPSQLRGAHAQRTVFRD